MIDIHSHILPGIDDGCKNIDDSINIICNAYNNGVTDIILTPHYIKNTKYNLNNKDKKKLYNKLKREVKKQKIEINIYLGNEVYEDKDIVKLLEDDICTLNNSKYILIEFSLTQECKDIEFVVGELINKGLVPVIAHPERYLYYYKNFDFFNNLIDNGCLLQGNISSIYGKYGRKPKKMIKYLLKRDMITFMSSDIHRVSDDVYTKDIEKELMKIVKSEEKVRELSVDNSKKIIENKNM